jgi:hypothetical protein
LPNGEIFYGAAMRAACGGAHAAGDWIVYDPAADVCAVYNTPGAVPELARYGLSGHYPWPNLGAAGSVQDLLDRTARVLYVIPSGAVDGADLAAVAAQLGQTACGGACDGDSDHDEDVDGSDLRRVSADFGRDDCP